MHGTEIEIGGQVTLAGSRRHASIKMARLVVAATTLNIPNLEPLPAGLPATTHQLITPDGFISVWLRMGGEEVLHLSEHKR